MTTKAYEFTHPDILVVSQVLSEVRMIHEFENESQWVLGGGVHPDEWSNALVFETTTC